MRGCGRALRGSAPVKSDKQLEAMPHAQFMAEFQAYKTEAARRIREMAELMGLAQSGKRGRKAANPLAELLSDGEDLELAEMEPADANGAGTSLS